MYLAVGGTKPTKDRISISNPPTHNWVIGNCSEATITQLEHIALGNALFHRIGYAASVLLSVALGCYVIFVPPYEPFTFVALGIITCVILLTVYMLRDISKLSAKYNNRQNVVQQHHLSMRKLLDITSRRVSISNDWKYLDTILRKANKSDSSEDAINDYFISLTQHDLLYLDPYTTKADKIKLEKYVEGRVHELIEKLGYLNKLAEIPIQTQREMVESANFVEKQLAEEQAAKNSEAVELLTKKMP